MVRVFSEHSLIINWKRTKSALMISFRDVSVIFGTLDKSDTAYPGSDFTGPGYERISRNEEWKPVVCVFRYLTDRHKDDGAPVATLFSECQFEL